MKKISCSVRHDRFFDNMHELAKNCCGIELIGIDIESYEELREWQKSNLDAINKEIQIYKVPIYYHSYFYDIDIGFSDKYMREYSLNSILNELDFCNQIGVSECIIHNAYKPGIVTAYYDFWISNYKKSLEVLLSKAEKFKIKLCIENFWDKDTIFSQNIINEFDSDYLGLCVDLGHINVFGNKNFIEWIEEFKDKIIVFHVTDNNGLADEHLAIGEGNIDYIKFFDIYKKLNLNSRINIETYNDVTAFTKSVSWIKKRTDFLNYT